MSEQRNVVVYASFSNQNAILGFNGSTNSIDECVLVMGTPFVLDGPEEGYHEFLIARITVPYSALYIDFDDEITALPEYVPYEVIVDGRSGKKTRYIDIIPLEVFISDEYGWYGTYLKSLDDAISIKWLPASSNYITGSFIVDGKERCEHLFVP